MTFKVKKRKKSLATSTKIIKLKAINYFCCCWCCCARGTNKIISSRRNQKKEKRKANTIFHFRPFLESVVIISDVNVASENLFHM